MVTGILMGDGSINRHRKNPYIQIGMISPNYLKYVAQQFGVLGSDVKIYRTAEELAKENRDSGFHPNADADDYSDMYRWQSMRHPELSEFADWYSNGEKVWPEDIELTPTVLKHWYCGDGSWSNSSSANYIQIAMANEIKNTDKVDEIFKKSGLPSPNNYGIGKNQNENKICNALFTVEQSKELWEYMGEPLPDFEYKWPDRYC
jgi:hypothetical protein